MNVLIACEESQTVCKAFRERGHRAFSCDLVPCSGGRPEWHIQGDALQLINGNCTFVTADTHTHTQAGPWDLLIAHPPCTYLSNLGANHLYCGVERVENTRGDTFRLMNEDRIVKAIIARDFFLAFFNADCKKIAIENPVPSSIWQLPKHTQMIQPFYFGDPFKKKTYLWLRGLQPLEHTNDVEPTGLWVDGGHAKETKMLTYGFRDSKKRSKTFPGIAKAMADQWGGGYQAAQLSLFGGI